MRQMAMSISRYLAITHTLIVTRGREIEMHIENYSRMTQAGTSPGIFPGASNWNGLPGTIPHMFLFLE